MERKKDWKDFQTLVNARPDYQAWLYCEDPEEKALRKELLSLVMGINEYAKAVRCSPMPAEMDDIYFTRVSAHIDQRITFSLFIETLFENCLRQGSNENLNLLFAFLNTYTVMLKHEYKWCKP